MVMTKNKKHLQYQLHEWIRLFVGEYRHGVKVGSGPKDVGPRYPSQSLKVGPRTILKFKSVAPWPKSKFEGGNPGSPSKCKNGTHAIFLDKYKYYIFEKWEIFFNANNFPRIVTRTYPSCSACLIQGRGGRRKWRRKIFFFEKQTNSFSQKEVHVTWLISSFLCVSVARQFIRLSSFICLRYHLMKNLNLIVKIMIRKVIMVITVVIIMIIIIMNRNIITIMIIIMMIKIIVIAKTKRHSSCLYDPLNKIMCFI